jgi:aminoglycoside 6'-N-acetyltransferase I
MCCEDHVKADDRGDTVVCIRTMDQRDRGVWLQMRGELWPEEPMLQHASAIEDVLQDEQAWGFIAENAAGTAVGFAEVSIRKAANGCATSPVPFLEGIWVRDVDRRQRIGAWLIRHVETFLADLGYRELGSDTLIDNLASQHAHIGWGFVETERVVYYRKELAISPSIPGTIDQFVCRR